MANNIAAELPLENDLLLWCSVTRKVDNGAGALVEEDVIGATDIAVIISATKPLHNALAIGDLTIPLANVSGTNRYWAVVPGDDVTTDLTAYMLSQVFVHFMKGTGDWHEVAATTVRDTKILVGSDLAVDLPLDNDFIMFTTLSRTVVNPTTGDREPATWTPVGVVEGYLSTSDSLRTGVTEHATLSKELAQSGSTNAYSNGVEGDDLSTHLAAQIGNPMHLHIKRGSEYHATHQFTVRDERLAA